MRLGTVEIEKWRCLLSTKALCGHEGRGEGVFRCVVSVPKLEYGVG